MHEEVYVNSIWITYYHFPSGWFTSVRFIIWEVRLAIVRWCLTSCGTYMCNAYITLFYFNDWVGWLCCVDKIVHEDIHNPVDAKLLVTWHICYMCAPALTSWHVFHLYLFSSVLVIYHFSIGYFISVHLIIWEVLLPIARWCLTSWETYIFIQRT